MRRWGKIVPVVAASAGLALAAGCGGDQGASDTTTTEFRPPTTTATTAAPPPPTLATGGSGSVGTVATTAPPTTAPAPLAAASAAQIAALVGDANWDPSLPLPAPCMGDAVFAPTIPGGSTGGTIRCTVRGFTIDDVAAFVRSTSSSRRLQFSESGTGPVRFAYGNVGTIEVDDRGGGVVGVTATQDYS